MGISANMAKISAAATASGGISEIISRMYSDNMSINSIRQHEKKHQAATASMASANSVNGGYDAK